MKLFITKNTIEFDDIAIRYNTPYVTEGDVRRILRNWKPRIEQLTEGEQFLPFSVDDEYVSGFFVSEVGDVLQLTAARLDGIGFDGEDEDVVQHMLAAEHEVDRRREVFAEISRADFVNALEHLLGQERARPDDP